MQDNVIDQTYYFLEQNKIQALGERRIGMGVMGLHDLLIYANKRYGSLEGNLLVNELFRFIAIKAYETSVEIAKEKGFISLSLKNITRLLPNHVAIYFNLKLSSLFFSNNVFRH